MQHEGDDGRGDEQGHVVKKPSHLQHQQPSTWIGAEAEHCIYGDRDGAVLIAVLLLVLPVWFTSNQAWQSHAARAFYLLNKYQLRE
jgi:hypothetical protein